MINLTPTTLKPICRQHLACEQLVHVATYEAAVINSRKDREMMDVACQLMQANLGHLSDKLLEYT